MTTEPEPDFGVPNAHPEVIAWGASDYWAGVYPEAWRVWNRPTNTSANNSGKTCQDLYENEGLWDDALVVWVWEMLMMAKLTWEEEAYLRSLLKPQVDEWGRNVE